MTIEGLGYLVEPNNQFVLPNGSPNVAGIVRVYYAGTDDAAITYRNFNGTRNPADIRLDNNGRAIIIADVTKAYRVEVRDSNGGLLWTVEPAYCIGGSGGGGGGGGSSVPLVRVKFQNGAWSKLYGDDGFIKANEFGQQALYLPECGWWHIDATLAVKNNTAQDLLQHILLEWNWNFFIEEGVPWGFYAAAGFPSMMHQIDYTRTATNNRCSGFVVNKDSRTNDWLSVGLNAYQDTLPGSVEWAVWMDIFKVRDA